MAWIRSTKWNGRKRREKRLYKTVYIKPRILPGTGETPIIEEQILAIKQKLT